MFSIKYLSKTGEIHLLMNKTISNISNYISQKLMRQYSVISDAVSTEVVSTVDDVNHSDGDVCIELMFKKRLYINKDDIVSRDRLDRLISEIKIFAEQAAKIEAEKYIPLFIKNSTESDNDS